MKNFKSFFSAVAVAATLIGCSSLEVEEEASIAENFPEDFSYTEYMELHPVLRYFQIKEYVKGDQAYGIDGYNDKVKQKAVASGTLEEYNAMVTADEAAFLADEATIHWLYTNPYVGGAWGFSEANWKKVINDTIAVTVYPVVKVKDPEDSTKVEKKLDAENPVLINLCDVMTKISRSTKAATKGRIDLLTGAIGEPCVGEGKPIVISDTTYVIANDSLILNEKAPAAIKTAEETFATETKEITSAKDAAAIKILKNINFYGTTDDTTMVSQIPVDDFAIGQHFVLFGKHHGWAYRKCKDSERSNARQCSNDANVKEVLANCALLPSEEDQQVCVNNAYAGGCEIYPADRMYCDDNGIAREIK